jgi:hypothetical protein
MAAQPKPSSGTPAPKTHFRFFRAHKVLTALLGTSVVAATAVIAAVIFSQEMVATPSTRTSPVVFVAGDDAANLDALDFIGANDPAVSASGAAATFTVYGIPGATSLSLGEVVDLQNAASSDAAAYAVTLSVSGVPSASLLAFELTFSDDVDGVPTPRTWNLLTQPSLPAYTLSDGESWEFTVSSLKMTPAASGSQGAMTISASMSA